MRYRNPQDRPKIGHDLALPPTWPLFSAADLENCFTALGPFCFPYLVFWCDPEDVVC